MAGLVAARHGTTGLCVAFRCVARPGAASRGMAMAGPGEAWFDQARRCGAVLCMAVRGPAGRGMEVGWLAGSGVQAPGTHARHGIAGQIWAVLVQARLGGSRHGDARRGMAWSGGALLGYARRSKARLGQQGDGQTPGFESLAPAQGWARRGAPWLGKARLGVAPRGAARLGKAGTTEDVAWPRSARLVCAQRAGAWLGSARQCRARQGQQKT
jgi:hypothetical protein